MTEEDFNAWKDSPATEWYFAALAAVAVRMEAGAKDRLFNSTSLTMAEWADLQMRAAHDKGYVLALNEMMNGEFVDFAEK